MMQTSLRGRQFIQGFETCELKAYPDPATKNDPVKRGKPWTNGWGHTGPDVYEGCPDITQAEADGNFEVDLAAFERDVNRLVTVQITQGMFDALVSFAYNVGSDIDEDTKAEGLGDSTLLRKLNAGDYRGAAEEFLKWNKANGAVMNGLTRRRKGERLMFLEHIEVVL